MSRKKKKIKNKKYVGTANLYYKGKCYGGTSRMVWAKNKTEARKKIKKMMKYKGNKVTVSNIHKPKY